jgi:hypothetical protein
MLGYGGHGLVSRAPVAADGLRLSSLRALSCPDPQVHNAPCGACLESATQALPAEKSRPTFHVKTGRHSLRPLTSAL